MTVVPLSQSLQMARTCDLLGLPVQWHDMADGSCLVQRRRWALGDVRLVSRGPLVPAPCVERALSQLLTSAGPILLNAEAGGEKTLKSLGFFPIMTEATLARVDLAPPHIMRAKLHQKWRNRLNRAEEKPVRLRVSRFPPDPDHWLLQAEMRQQRQKRYRNLPARWLAGFAVANPDDALLFEARAASELIGGVLILRHGPTATYQVGVTTAAGRQVQALRLMLWHAMCHLANDGCLALELGLIDGKTAPGLARFKLGLGAKALQLGGTWLHHRALAPLARRLPQALAA